MRLGVGNSQSYSFDIDEQFFSGIDSSEIKSGKLKSLLTLMQQDSSYIMQFSVEGFVSVICDRCLDLCKVPVQVESEIVANIGEETVFDTGSDNITVAGTDNELNISILLYELIVTSLPFKRVHNTEMGADQLCNPEMIKILNKYLVENENPTDPRWDKLKELNLKK